MLPAFSRIAGVRQLTADEIERRFKGQAAAKLDVTVRLEAGDGAVAADELDKREFAVVVLFAFRFLGAEALCELLFPIVELLFAERIAEHVVLDVVAKHVNSPSNRSDRARTEMLNPKPVSDCKSGLPISNARLPGCGPKKSSSSSAGFLAARARLTATTKLSLAASG